MNKIDNYVIDRINNIQPTEIAAHIGLTAIGNKVDEFICPECGNGSGHDHTGVKPNYVNGKWLWNCLKNCGFSGDNVKLLGKHYGLDTRGADYLKLIRRACDDFGIDYEETDDEGWKASGEGNAARSTSTSTESCATKEQELIQADIEKARANLDSLPENCRRGLTLETLKKFGCGYLADWILPEKREEKNPPKSSRIIIPNSAGYLARATDKNNPVPKFNVGHKGVFGLDLLPAVTSLPILAVEGEVDAMSIAQVSGVNVVASCGAGNIRNLVAGLNQKFSGGEKPRVIVLLDSDETGRSNAPKMTAALIEAGYPAVAKFLSKETTKVDANDILRDEGESKLAEIIGRIVDESAEEFRAIEERENSSSNAKSSRADNDVAKIEEEIAAFDEESAAAIERLANLQTFSRESLCTDEILTACAFAKLYDRAAFSRVKEELQKYNKEHSDGKFSIPDLYAAIKPFERDISSRRAELELRLNKAKAAAKTKAFLADNDILRNFNIPGEYEFSAEGISELRGKAYVLFCRRPLVITENLYGIDDSTYSLRLSFKSKNRWHYSPIMARSDVFNQRTLPSIADYGFPVTSDNSRDVVRYLDAFLAANEEKISVTYTTAKCGWRQVRRDGKTVDEFVDPRREITIASGYDDSAEHRLIVDESKNAFAQNLKSLGSLDEWKRAYDLAKASPVARFVVAVCIAPPLLYILGERNFIVYMYGKTLAGKTTVMELGASAVGNVEGLIKTLNATKKGLDGVAAETNHYVILADEKQAADSSLTENIHRLIYSWGNGIGRTKLNKDSTLKPITHWKAIALMNGETTLVEDNVTGGAHTRLLQIAVPEKILPPETCGAIRDIIKENYGLALPLVIDKIFKVGSGDLRDVYKVIISGLAEKAPEVLADHVRYIAVVTLADALLNMALEEEETAAITAARNNALEILKLIPSTAEISDTEREWNFITNFIAQNINRFDETASDVEHGDVYGKFDKIAGCVYVIQNILKAACKSEGFDYKKVETDMIEAGYFTPDNKIKAGRKSPLKTVQARIRDTNTRCYKIESRHLEEKTFPFDDCPIEE